MDPVHFSGKEILDMAIRIEENGVKYYNDAAKAAKSKDLKDLFKALADEEGSHIRAFNELKSLLHGDEFAEAGPYPYGDEASLYLSAIADTEVFTGTEKGKGKELASQVHDGVDVLRVAIDMEKDSLLFYYELARMIRDKDRPVVENLIEQEKSHVRKLTDAMKRLG